MPYRVVGRGNTGSVSVVTEERASAEAKARELDTDKLDVEIEELPVEEQPDARGAQAADAEDGRGPNS